jgi:hypothetical protein
MKKICLMLIVFSLYNLSAHSQESDLQSSINKWKGLWKGLSGNDSISLHIIQTVGPAEKDVYNNRNFVGMYGWHAIKKDAVITESSLPHVSDTWNESCTITGALSGISDTLHLVIKDLTRNRLLGAYLILKKDETAVLQTWMKETFRADGKTYPEGQSFPKEISLVRAAAEK